MLYSFNRNIDFFDIVIQLLQGDILAPYVFIICQDYVLWTSIDIIKENGFILKKTRSRQYPTKTMIDQDYTDNLALLTNTLSQAESLSHSLEWVAAGISLYVNANKTEFKCFKQEGAISTLVRIFQQQYLIYICLRKV